MAGIKINDLTPLGRNLISTDELELSLTGAAGSRKITGAQLTAGLQPTLSLTTTGTSGAATLVGSTLNIPQYSGGGGLQGPHALIPLASGNITSPIIQSISSGSSSTFVGNRINAYPFIPNQNITTSNLYVFVAGGSAGSLCRIAIYDDLNGYPNNRLYLSSDLDLSTNGQKTALTTFNFVAGTIYWLAFHGNSIATNATMNNFASQVLLPIRMSSATVSPTNIFNSATFTTGTPDPFPPLGSYAATNIPAILITKA